MPARHGASVDLRDLENLLRLHGVLAVAMPKIRKSKAIVSAPRDGRRRKLAMYVVEIPSRVYAADMTISSYVDDCPITVNVETYTISEAREYVARALQGLVDQEKR
jgi:hypothetical protein